MAVGEDPGSGDDAVGVASSEEDDDDEAERTERADPLESRASRPLTLRELPNDRLRCSAGAAGVPDTCGGGW